VENFFHRERVGFEFAQDAAKLNSDLLQSLLQRIDGAGANDAGSNQPVATAVGFDDAKAGLLGSAVYANYSH
jgi:hypothetical protein